MLLRYPSGFDSDCRVLLIVCWIPVLLLLLGFLQAFLSVKLRCESTSEPLDFLSHMLFQTAVVMCSTQDPEELILVYCQDFSFLAEALG